MKLGIALGRLHPERHLEATLAAEAAGLESVWMPEHLVFPVDTSGSPYPGAEHPPVPPTTPVFDAFAWLAWLAGKTERIRLGTNVYLLGLRHPFVAARAVQTLDLVSGGRAELGVGAGWLREEWAAAGLDPATRGRRLDEAIGVCKRLWTEETIEHEGRFYRFPAVAFEPKPVQRPWPRIHVGGESDAALWRAARHGDGWIGLGHEPESARSIVSRLRGMREELELFGEPFEISVHAERPDAAAVAAFTEAGVDRLICTPWARSRDAVAAIESLASTLG